MKKIIFSQTFPEASPQAMLNEADELCRNIPDTDKPVIPSFEEMTRRFREDYIYKPRPEAAEKSKRFISYAIDVCKEFEIDTVIIEYEHEIVVNMELYSLWYGGSLKHALEKLLILADVVSFAPVEDKVDYICISTSYYMHDTFRGGRKVELW